MAAAAHEGQTTAFPETPYIAHPVSVAGLVMGVFGCTDPEVVAAALLHDTLEKTSLEAEEIREAMGDRVLRLVLALTKDGSGDDEARWRRLAEEGWEARLIKMGDALDHLNCGIDDLPHRIESAGRALELGFSEEEPIRLASEVLHESLRTAEVRLASILTPG
ncbi:MAG: HD domain-containing protein [Verrucomicrobiota bacterium]